MSSSGPYTAVVTGASGFVATEVVKQLLEKGYDVRGTVRSLASKEKVSHLEALAAGLPGNLKLYEADLLKEGSFDEVLHGSDYVFHTASPFLPSHEDPYKELIEPALNGTKNVLGSVSKNKSTIKRVVLTSSFAAVFNGDKGPSNPPRYSEKDWNTVSTAEEGAYRYSKTLAEKAAWEISGKEGFELATINPTLVLGPVISARKDATSIMKVTDMLEGRDCTLLTWLCDVRDVARAHVLCIENPKAKGHRFIVSQGNTFSNKYMTDALKARFPNFAIKDGKDEPSKPLIDNSNALQLLGLGRLHDPAESIVDMATTLINNGVTKPQTT